jgi:hypothetical protein
MIRIEHQAETEGLTSDHTECVSLHELCLCVAGSLAVALCKKGPTVQRPSTESQLGHHKNVIGVASIAYLVFQPSPIGGRLPTVKGGITRALMVL